MLSFILSQILFYITMTLVLFLPGYVLLLALFGKSKIMSSLEKFIIAFGLSLVSVDFLTFIYDKAGFYISRWSIIFGIAIFISIGWVIYKRKKTNYSEPATSLFNFSKNEFRLILLLLFLTFFIKTAYLSGSILPNSTDMGHHMYWSKWMVENGKLPTYDGMPDFIIGEHIPFSIIGMITGLSFFSAFPPVILFLINLLSILAVFILVLRIFENKSVAILSILFLGVLYAVSSPQAKFVNGGVVGNIFGNFLTSLAFYFYYRASEFLKSSEADPDNNSKKFLGLALFLTFGLFYTHHLTAFIFLFIFAFLTVLFLVINYRDIEKILPKILKLISSPYVWGSILLGLVFFFFVFTPTYIENNAVNTAVGEASKATRTGLTFKNLRSSVGEARIALGIIGLAILAFTFKRRNFGYAIVAAWSIMIYIMSSQPHLLFINLPSSRIGNYLTYPMAILAAYAFYYVFKKSQSNYLIKLGFLIVLAFCLINGLSDSASVFKNKIEINEVSETFNASSYLAQTSRKSNGILKDHNYLTADAWIKLFFMRGYKYPESRGLFSRYEDATKPRENCTLKMISEPGGNEAKECFDNSGIDFIMVNPRYDSGQFRKLEEFNQVFTANNVAVFYRK